MKERLFLASVLVASSSFAANFGSPTAVSGTPAGTAAATAAAVSAPAAGPQIAPAFRIVKPDGATVITQGTVGASVVSGTPINVADTDAFLTSGGMCAFNVKYDEISGVAATGTTNRLYSNDRLIAQNTMIDLAPGALKTIWTQPYLVPGVNNVRIVVNAAGAAPSTGWIRINVAGTCGRQAAAAAPVVTPPAPATPKPAPVVTFKPGSGQWNNFYNAWGYSNYAVKQLQGKGYPRYLELVNLNSLIASSVATKSVNQSVYNQLMASWNTFVGEAAFKAAMAAIVPGTPGKK